MNENIKYAIQFYTDAYDDPFIEVTAIFRSISGTAAIFGLDADGCIDDVDLDKLKGKALENLYDEVDAKIAFFTQIDVDLNIIHARKSENKNK